jgi:hypothetical protein
MGGGAGATRPREGSGYGRQRALVILEVATGVMGLAGGLLLAVAPDGSLMHADPGRLAGSPFTDWRLPGVALAVLVGVGFLVTGWWQSRAGPHARELSVAAGTGLVLFELAELGWIGFQPLQAFFALVGVVIIALAGAVRRPPAHPLR